MIDREMSRGLIKVLVLQVIAELDVYGYLLIKSLYDKTNGVFDLKDGTIYPILHALERDKSIKSYWEESDTGRKRKYYTITKLGIKVLDDYKSQWEILSDAVNVVLEGS